LAIEERKVLIIRQRWVKGDSWWTSYERLINGKTVLEARRVKKLTTNELKGKATAHAQAEVAKFHP
jgi:hypothetical protein